MEYFSVFTQTNQEAGESLPQTRLQIPGISL